MHLQRDLILINDVPFVSKLFSRTFYLRKVVTSHVKTINMLTKFQLWNNQTNFLDLDELFGRNQKIGKTLNEIYWTRTKKGLIDLPSYPLLRSLSKPNWIGFHEKDKPIHPHDSISRLLWHFKKSLTSSAVSYSPSFEYYPSLSTNFLISTREMERIDIEPSRIFFFLVKTILFTRNHESNSCLLLLPHKNRISCGQLKKLRSYRA